jgi:hypothetical protein
VNPLSRNSRDWLYALALTGMLLRVSMPLWALPQLSADGFMLMCTSAGVQWLLGEDLDNGPSAQQLPCAQCATHAAGLDSQPFSPPAPQPLAPSPRPRFAEALDRAPPFLVAPPNRAPPRLS